MQPFAFIPTTAVETQASEKPVVLQRATVLHFDGATEPVLVQQPAPPASSPGMPATLHRHLVITYLLVGTIALALSAWATIKILQKSK